MRSQGCGLILGLVFLLQAGCTPVSFEADKASLLKSNSVFGNNSGEDPAIGGIPQIGEAGANGSIPQEIPVERRCSDEMSEEVMNFKLAKSTSAERALLVNGSVCTTDPAAIDAAVSAASLSFNRLKMLCPSIVKAPTKKSFNNRVALRVAGKVHTTSDSSQVIGDDDEFFIVYDGRRILNAEGELVTNPDTMCTSRRSPLVIHIASDPKNPKAINLSSQADGIDFDIAGKKNDHVPMRISWFTNHDYRLLTLPDASGKITGVDQLFGDGTTGPDGRLARNGYHALSKYDGTSVDGRKRVGPKNGYIDRNDAIYPQLRLWLDKNFDGVSTADELSTLASAGIQYVDLRYSNKFLEVDDYGNITKMKSVVGLEDGSLDLIFDLWFNAHEIGN